MTRMLLEIIGGKESDFQIEETQKQQLKDIVTANVFFDYERLERDEPEIEFDENAKQPEGLELKTTVRNRYTAASDNVQTTIYVGQGKLFDEWAPHGVGIEVTKEERDFVFYKMGIFDQGSLCAGKPYQEFRYTGDRDFSQYNFTTKLRSNGVFTKLYSDGTFQIFEDKSPSQLYMRETHATQSKLGIDTSSCYSKSKYLETCTFKSVEDIVSKYEFKAYTSNSKKELNINFI